MVIRDSPSLLQDDPDDPAACYYTLTAEVGQKALGLQFVKGEILKLKDANEDIALASWNKENWKTINGELKKDSKSGLEYYFSTYNKN